MRIILLSVGAMILAGCAATPNMTMATNAAEERQAAEMAGREAPPPWSLRRPGVTSPGWGAGYRGFIYQRH